MLCSFDDSGLRSTAIGKIQQRFRTNNLFPRFTYTRKCHFLDWHLRLDFKPWLLSRHCDHGNSHSFGFVVHDSAIQNVLSQIQEFRHPREPLQICYNCSSNFLCCHLWLIGPGMDHCPLFPSFNFPPEQNLTRGFILGRQSRFFL